MTAAARLRLPGPSVLLGHYFAIAISIGFVISVVAPLISHLSARNDSPFLFDSSLYWRASEQRSVLSVLRPHLDWSSGGALPSLDLTNSALILEGKLARFLFPFEPHIGVFAINYAFFLTALRSCRTVTREIGASFDTRIQLAIAANPFIWMNMVSLTKEVLGLTAVCAFASFIVRGRFHALVGIAVLSMIAREYYIVLALGMWFVARMRRHPAWFFGGAAFVMGILQSVFHVGDITGFANERAATIGERSAGLMVALSHIQAIPFGDLVAAPVILAVNLVSPVVSPTFLHAPTEAWYVHATTASAILFLAALGIWFVRRGELSKLAVAPIARCLFAYAVLVTLYPISQHRYLLPAYPLLVVLALSRAQRVEGALDARRGFDDAQAGRAI